MKKKMRRAQTFNRLIVIIARNWKTGRPTMGPIWTETHYMTRHTMGPIWTETHCMTICHLTYPEHPEYRPGSLILVTFTLILRV